MSTGDLWAILGPVLGLYVALAAVYFRLDNKIDQIHRDFVQHLRDDHGIKKAAS